MNILSKSIAIVLKAPSLAADGGAEFAKGFVRLMEHFLVSAERVSEDLRRPVMRLVFRPEAEHLLTVVRSMWLDTTINGTAEQLLEAQASILFVEPDHDLKTVKDGWVFGYATPREPESNDSRHEIILTGEVGNSVFVKQMADQVLRHIEVVRDREATE